MAQSDASRALAEMHATLFDPSSMFSVSAVLAQLDEIEPSTRPDSVERGEVMHLRSFVEGKGGRAEESIRHGEVALRIEALHPFLSLKDRVGLHYSVARQAEQAGDCETAIPQYQAVLPLMEQLGTSLGGRLGTQQSLGYCLHEVKRFAEARHLNEATLAAAAALYGPDDPKLFSARTNLAENEYALGDHAAARRTLEALLADAAKARDDEVVDRVLFVLGVVAFEDGRRPEALAFMQRRLALAEASGETERVAAATRDLDVLRDKLSEAP